MLNNKLGGIAMNNKLHRIVTAPWKAWRSKQLRLSISFEFLGLHYAVLILVMLSLFLGTAGCKKATEPEAPTPEQQLEQANQTFRSTVASAMQEAAKLAGVTIKTDNFVAILLDDGSSVVVNAGIAGVENLTLEQLAKGADVLFVFLRVPQGSGLPSGFYTVRFFQTPGTTQWKAQFRNLEGQVALETDAEVGPGDLAREIPKLTGGFGCDFDKGECWIKIDIRWKNAYAKASVRVGTGGPDPTPLPAAGQVIAQATAKFYEEARGIINTVKTNTYRQVIIGSRDDYLVVHTAFRGVQILPGELAQSHDILFCYIRPPQSSDLPTGFYTVRIAQSATGEWVARFVDAKGNTVKEVRATVDRVEPPLQTTKLTMFLNEEGFRIGGAIGEIEISFKVDLR
jgi:hypothetical protein